MRIFKPRKGKGRKWYIDYVDGLGIRRRVAGFVDKQATEQRAAELVRNADRESSGLTDRYEQHRKTPLAKHVADWSQSLIDGERTASHVLISGNRVRLILAGTKALFWGELDPNRVKRYLKDRRSDGLSTESSNHYVRAAKAFCAWMVRSSRARENPLACLSKLNSRMDRRHDRRALSADELRRLLDSTRKSDTRFGMTGADREMLYTFAVETGLRVGELRTLTWGACDLDGDSPTATVSAAYSKHRREDVQPLRPATAAMLAVWRDERGPVDRLHSVFPSMPEKTAAMIRADLEDARAAWIEEATNEADAKRREESDFLLYCDHSGRFTDFHSLRHTFITALARGDVHPTIAQGLARHATIGLTMDTYTHRVIGDLAAGLDALPDLDRTNPTQERHRATGTCDIRPNARATGVAKYVPNSSRRKSIPLHPVALSGENGTGSAERENATEQEAGCTPLHVDAPHITDESESEKGKTESPRNGFVVR